MAEKILMSEYKALSKEPWTNIELVNENIFEWIVALVVTNSDSIYNGGYFKAKMTFPKNYPYNFKFLRPLFHPNVYPDGRLCISILHPPGEDEMSGELASERWSPAQRVESVLISILSLLDDAEPSSPANVDAGVMLRNNFDKYKERARQETEASKRDIPADFVMPSAQVTQKKEAEEHGFSWSDSEAEDDFGSDTDEEMGFEDEDEEMEEGDAGSDSDE